MQTCVVYLMLCLAGCIAKQCPVPSSLWCSSYEIAEACQVVPHCLKNEWIPVRNNAPLVNFTLYYESLCPDCRQMITTQVYPAFKAIGSIFNLTLVPYGNAEEKKVGNKWVFDCQHGQQECDENILDTCCLNLVKDITKSFPFIHCMEKGPRRSAAAFKKCSKKFPSIPAAQIQTCSQSAQGNQWEHEMAVRTDALNPKHTYVPWVTLNGVHNEHIQNRAQSDLIGLICDAYTGQKPSGCQKTMKTQRCQKSRPLLFQEKNAMKSTLFDTLQQFIKQ